MAGSKALTIAVAGTLPTPRIGTTDPKNHPTGHASAPAKISRGYRARLEKSHHISIRLWFRTSQTEVDVSRIMKLYAMAVPQPNAMRKVTARRGWNGQCIVTREIAITAAPIRMLGAVDQSI